MKFFKKGLKVTVVLLVLIVVGTWLYSKTYHPKYDGEIELKNLSEKVTVILMKLVCHTLMLKTKMMLILP